MHSQFLTTGSHASMLAIRRCAGTEERSASVLIDDDSMEHVGFGFTFKPL